MSVAENNSQRDTITTEEKNRKSKIFTKSNQVSVREGRISNERDNIQELISFTNRKEVNLKENQFRTINFHYSSPIKDKC